MLVDFESWRKHVLIFGIVAQAAFGCETEQESQGSRRAVLSNLLQLIISLAVHAFRSVLYSN